jgi:hypothetical protein
MHWHYFNGDYILINKNNKMIKIFKILGCLNKSLTREKISFISNSKIIVIISKLVMKP